ncbi:uncharacterized protein LOC124290602 [Haliotis rubra]|uniref:uncharacterized protein LOC124290602 n=1 Tax=Haliotis rubra TaxID=36100 RepID=UPI001EE55D7E|nr:uncharacterized protein LOC124290602 [Haliotis rubra]XP_046583318.1 uncharacterized protein LOC124290602 [Haliotis rubra]
MKNPSGSFMSCATATRPLVGWALTQSEKTFDAWLDGYGSPKQIHGETDINGFQPIVTEYLPELLCLSIQCPFDDVREALADILEDVKKRGRGLHVPRRLEKGASHFISEKEVLLCNMLYTQICCPNGS